MSLGKAGTAQASAGASGVGGRRTPSLLWSPLVAIGAAAFAVEIPFFFLGTPSGHDVEFHLYSWLEVLAQWKQGIVFPRWAWLANFGYGEPRFVFYPPASWMLGALISKIFPWAIASGVYIWLALVLAGGSMFVLARRWLDRRDALFAAVLYAVNPYHIVIVYWRSAFAELLASWLVPLLLLGILKALEEGNRAIVPLGLVLAAGWLINAPSALMVHYSLAFLILFFAWQRRSMQMLAVAAGAIALGAALAAFYLLPAIYEQRWIEIGNAVSAGSRPADNFLFAHTTDPEHDAFNRLISWVAVLEMVVLGAALWAARAWRQSNRRLWTGLVGWAVACGVMMLPGTTPLWTILPKLQFMQFPWRWLLCLSVLFSLLVSIAMRSWWWRAAVCLVSLAVIAVGWHRIQAPWWDTTGDLREMRDNMEGGAGYEGTDEYLPVGAVKENIDKDSRKVTATGPVRAAIRVLQWNAESKSFTAETSAPDQLALRLFAYPAWRVEVNGREVATLAREGTGQMLVPVERGMNRVQLTLVRTWDRTLGGWISILSGLVLLFWKLTERRSSRQSDRAQHEAASGG